MDVDTVEAYLLENLKWRVAAVSNAVPPAPYLDANRSQFDATRIACEDVADLSITIVSAEVQPAIADDAFPQWGNFTKLKAFHGQQCGV